MRAAGGGEGVSLLPHPLWVPSGRRGRGAPFPARLSAQLLRAPQAGLQVPCSVRGRGEDKALPGRRWPAGAEGAARRSLNPALSAGRSPGERGRRAWPRTEPAPGCLAGRWDRGRSAVQAGSPQVAVQSRAHRGGGAQEGFQALLPPTPRHTRLLPLLPAPTGRSIVSANAARTCSRLEQPRGGEGLGGLRGWER